MQSGEQDRYSRQELFAPVGTAGQRRLRASTAAVVGCGALGSLHAEALVRAGIGRLILIDRDTVEWSNLQRQWLYDEFDARNETPKAVAAAGRLEQINHEVQMERHVSDLTPSNAEELLAGSDVILDGTDNFETRYLLNDISVKFGIPWMYGAAIGSYGLVMPVLPAAGPCFACVYPEPPAGLQPTCDVNGILAATTGAVASLQVALALRTLVGWDDFRPFIQTLDVWQGTFQRIGAGPRDQQCPVCALKSFPYLDGRRRVPVSLCGRNAVQLHESARAIDLKQLAERLQRMGPVRVNEFALRMTLPRYEVTFFPDGRAIVKGTTDVGVARGVYAQLLGA